MTFQTSFRSQGSKAQLYVCGTYQLAYILCWGLLVFLYSYLQLLKGAKSNQDFIINCVMMKINGQHFLSNCWILKGLVKNYEESVYAEGEGYMIHHNST